MQRHADRITAEVGREGHGELVLPTLVKLAAVSGAARLWDPDSRQLRTEIDAHAEEIHAVAFSPDGTILATASADRTVRLWEPENGRSMGDLTGHKDIACAVAFSPDGKLVATGRYDDRVAVGST
jgi:WD40 repeat protein